MALSRGFVVRKDGTLRAAWSSPEPCQAELRVELDEQILHVEMPDEDFADLLGHLTRYTVADVAENATAILACYTVTLSADAKQAPSRITYAPGTAALTAGGTEGAALVTATVNIPGKAP